MKRLISKGLKFGNRVEVFTPQRSNRQKAAT